MGIIMEKFIAFIGSNSRKLYVEDIYRLMVLPNEYVIQYRYQYKYIDDKILQKLDSLKGKQSIIHYCYDPKNLGYVGTIRDIGEKKVFLPIRKAFIKDISINEEIGQVNFFLELYEFIDTELHVNSDLSNQRFKDIFVGEVDVMHYKETTWLEKVESVQDYFNDLIFFHIKNISGNYTINYNFDEKKTNLILSDDSPYIFEFLTYDKTDGSSYIEIHTEDSFINLNDTLEKGTKVNSKKITLDTKPIDFRRDRTYIEFKDFKSEFGVRISVILKKKFWRSFLFGFLSSIALLSFQVSNLLIRDNMNKENIGFLILAAIVVNIGVSGLHWFYNKK
jgi:hypothetical protein